MMRRPRSISVSIGTTGTALLLGLASCTIGPKFHRPEPQMPPEFASKRDKAMIHAEQISATWWKQLHDDTLNRLVSRATSANRELAVAEARLREARTLWREAQFDLAPVGHASAFYENTEASAAAIPSGSLRPRSLELYHAGFDATWELDFFGRTRRSIEAAEATVAAVSADRDDLIITLTAEVVRNYLELRGTQAQLEVARSNAANQEDSVRVAKVSLDGGRGTQLDVAQATAQWNATLAKIPAFEEQIAQIIHRIAVLCGQNPSELRASLHSVKPQPALPGSVTLVKPVDLLRQRPDIRAAEKSLAAATARVGVAVADLFPRVTFNGSIGIEASTIGGKGSRASSFGPHLTWAAFDLGRVRQQITAAGARADAELARYEQTVLNALEEAENALTSYDREQARLHFLEASARSADEAARLARQRYKDGVTDFLSELVAERVALDAQNEVVVSRTRAATAWVRVCKAMGGGWSGQ